MSWTPAASHLMKQRPRKRGPRHEGSESTKWKEEISYPDSETLMSIYVFFPVLHFASLIYGNPLFGCYKGLRLSSSRLYIFKQYVYSHGQFLVWRVAIYCWLWHWDVEDLLAFYRYCYLIFFDLLQNMDRDPYLVEHSSMIACMMAQGAN